MNKVKEEVIKVLSIIEESINVNCPDEGKIKEIEETKSYIINNLNNKEENKIGDQ